MTPIELRAPDGTLYAYACAECRRVQGGVSLWGADRYTDAEVARLAEVSRSSALRCCTCHRCGGYQAPSEHVARDAPDVCETCLDGGAREEWQAHRAKWQREADRFEHVREVSLAKALDRHAALALEDLMGEMSENYWCAGWLTGTEHALWGFVENGPGKWGMGTVRAEEIERLRELSQQAGGWWRWLDADEAAGVGAGCAFVPIAEWRESEGRDG